MYAEVLPKFSMFPEYHYSHVRRSAAQFSILPVYQLLHVRRSAAQMSVSCRVLGPIFVIEAAVYTFVIVAAIRGYGTPVRHARSEQRHVRSEQRHVRSEQRHATSEQ